MTETLLQEAQKQSEMFSFQDILDARNLGGRELTITKKYDPTLFWNFVADEYYKTFKTLKQFEANVPWLSDRLKVVKVDNVLEVGCGFARVAPFLFHAGLIKKYTGIDISQKAIECAKEYLTPSAVQGATSVADYREHITLDVGDSKRLPYESSTFECVMTVETLQHLPEADAHESFREILRVSKKYIMLLERWSFPGEHSEPHLWTYPYSQWVKDAGVDLLQVCGLGNNIQGVIAQKKEL